jgi:hypothetical protein
VEKYQTNERGSSMTDKAEKSAPAEETIVSYKGFDKDWKCRDFQYKIGETFRHEGSVKACESGFHGCEYPLDVFGYYSPAGNRFAVVEQSGELSRHNDDSKVASRSISIMAEISISGLVEATIEYTSRRCKPIDPESPASATGTQGAASATGDQGAASATGYKGAASATGIQGAASATGYYGAASATSYKGAASATGYKGAASATGYKGAASATGDHGAASATGTQGAASATGDQGAASATGIQGAASATGYYGAASATSYKGAASATGDHGAASATGTQGAASATGDYGAASATGKASVAAATGLNGSAKGASGCAIVLVRRDVDGTIIHIRASKVGENGVKPGVWYSLDENGEFMECAE